MANVHFEGKFRSNKSETLVGLSLFKWKEDDLVYVFSPALDMYGYGATEDEAKQSFELNLNEFVKYTENKKTIFDELERLGWTINRKKSRVRAPELSEMMIDNVDLRSILSNPDIIQENTNVELALA